MGVTGQISIARVGRTVQIKEREEDISSVFDPNQSPTLQPGDHVTLYPGDYREPMRKSPIAIPENVFLTILPGAVVEYGNLRGPLEQRYTYIEGATQNIADLNIAHQYTTQVEKQSPRVRVYPEDVTSASGASVPFSSFDNVTGAIGSEVPFSGFDELAAAADAAESGDTIIVFPGRYTPVRNLFVNGVTWHFLDGAIVEYTPSFENIYPHALFDDLKSVDGTSDPGGKSLSVQGNGEFIIGTPNPQPSDLSSFNSSSISTVDWEGWHMYSLLGVNNSSSNVGFEAKRVEMKNYVDGAIKLSGTGEVNIDVEKIDILDSLQADSTLPTSQIPAFAVFNGVRPSLVSGNVSIKVGDLNIKTGSTPPTYFAIGLNHNSSRREPFEGSVKFRIGESETNVPQTNSDFIRFSDSSSPKKLTLEGSTLLEGNAGVALQGTTGPTGSLPVTKLIVKNSEISTANVPSTPPITLSGDSDGFDIHFSGSRFLTGEDIDYTVSNISTFSVGNLTNTTDFDIKVYDQCFADAPIEDFDSILHDELNNISWSSEVKSLS